MSKDKNFWTAEIRDSQTYQLIVPEEFVGKVEVSCHQPSTPLYTTGSAAPLYLSGPVLREAKIQWIGIDEKDDSYVFLCHWLSQIYQQNSQQKFDKVDLILRYHPDSTLKETWHLDGCFPSSVDFGCCGDDSQFNVTFKYESMSVFKV